MLPLPILRLPTVHLKTNSFLSMLNNNCSIFPIALPLFLPIASCCSNIYFIRRPPWACMLQFCTVSMMRKMFTNLWWLAIIRMQTKFPPTSFCKEWLSELISYGMVSIIPFLLLNCSYLLHFLQSLDNCPCDNSNFRRSLYIQDWLLPVSLIL